MLTARANKKGIFPPPFTRCLSSIFICCEFGQSNFLEPHVQQGENRMPTSLMLLQGANGIVHFVNDQAPNKG